MISLKKKNPVDYKRILDLEKRWRRRKLPVHMKFFLSRPNIDNTISSYEEWFVVEKDNEIIAFCSLLPYLQFGELSFYVDHLIYDPEKGGHSLSYLISYIIELIKDEGVNEINLGLNPFAQVENKGLMGRLFNLLYKIPFFYKPKGLHYFKKKFGGIEEREYCFFERNKTRWSGLAEMAKVTLGKTDLRL
ncbi:MAG: DUF2156 domain-containing protein [Bdellovibrionales bacterium]|nr:phosphatidylglycerol lysyltransferase domain-containing protein [Bdellovibrionales bacterium]NQZ19179.1 DUF2156 domain-containing protein [Bdellovibrionales bacterium]